MLPPEMTPTLLDTAIAEPPTSGFSWSSCTSIVNACDPPTGIEKLAGLAIGVIRCPEKVTGTVPHTKMLLSHCPSVPCPKPLPVAPGGGLSNMPLTLESTNSSNGLFESNLSLHNSLGAGTVQELSF